jgi:hypothetical protein
MPRGNYSFAETSQLGGKVLSSRGNVMDGDEVTVAIRHHGNYSYKLYVS